MYIPTTTLLQANTIGAELTYAQITGDVSSSQATEASADTVVTAGAVVFDGATIVLVEFFTQRVNAAGVAANGQVVLNLFDGASDIGRIAQVGPGAQTGGAVPVHAIRRLTPSAASHTYSIRMWVSPSGTGIVQAGAGGAATSMPAFIRITRAA